MLSLLTALTLATAPPPQSVLAEPSVGGHPFSARGLAMGGAQRGIADQTDGIFVNPAGLAAKKHYIIAADYSWTQEANDHRPGASIIDSVTTVVAAAFSYSYEARINSANLGVHRLYFGLAYNIGGLFSVGVSMKYQVAERQKATYDSIFDPEDPNDPNKPRKPLDPNFSIPALNFSGVTGDLGCLFTPIEYISLAVVGHNLIPNPLWNEFAPIALGIGVAGHVYGLELDVDTVIDFTTRAKATPRVHVGAEYTIASMVPIRAGFIVDKVGQDMFWSVGAGFRHPSFGIDFGYRQAVERPNNRTLAIAVQYYMN
jgi:hypothetical protein